MTNEQQKIIERFREEFTYPCSEVMSRLDLKSSCGSEALEQFLLKEISEAYEKGYAFSKKQQDQKIAILMEEVKKSEKRGEEKERERIIKSIPSSCFSHIGEDLLEKSGIQINSQDPKEEKK